MEQRFEEDGGQCIIRTYTIGKYGHWVAEIFFADSDRSLNQEMLDQGLAEEV